MQTTFSDLNQRYPPSHNSGKYAKAVLLLQDKPPPKRSILLFAVGIPMRIHLLLVMPPIYSEKRRKREDLMCAAATTHLHPCNI
jgi:hypothetical protein